MRHFHETASTFRTAELQQTKDSLLKELERGKGRELKLKELEQKARVEAKRRRILAMRLVRLLEEDRRRIALTLHDDVGQDLSGAKMWIENVLTGIKQKEPDLAELLEQSIAVLQKAISHLRETSRQLRPSSLDMLGLTAALRSLGNDIQKDQCRVFYLFGDLPETLNPDLELAVFRIAQEAFENAVRHAGCSEIHLSLSTRDDHLLLMIEDDGCGFSWEATESDHSTRGPVGLNIMRERAAFLGGRLWVDSNPGRGTTVLAEFPLQAQASFLTETV